GLDHLDDGVFVVLDAQRHHDGLAVGGVADGARLLVGDLARKPAVGRGEADEVDTLLDDREGLVGGLHGVDLGLHGWGLSCGWGQRCLPWIAWAMRASAWLVASRWRRA